MEQKDDAEATDGWHDCESSCASTLFEDLSSRNFNMPRRLDARPALAAVGHGESRVAETWALDFDGVDVGVGRYGKGQQVAEGADEDGRNRFSRGIYSVYRYCRCMCITMVGSDK